MKLLDATDATVLMGTHQIEGKPNRFLTLTVPYADDVARGAQVIEAIDMMLASGEVPLVVLREGFLLGFTDLAED